MIKLAYRLKVRADGRYIVNTLFVSKELAEEYFNMIPVLGTEITKVTLTEVKNKESNKFKKWVGNNGEYL